MTCADALAHSELQHVNIIEDISRRKQGFPDSFRLGKFLGKGGFAKCYEAVDSNTGVVYAAKIVCKTSVAKPRALAKLRSEIAIHRSMDHDKVVKFYDYFEDSEKVYILLELCPNATLNEYMRNRPHKRLSEPEAIFYIYDLIMGLKHLHGRHIIHRDLKLGNLFLDADARIKIGDFGLAARLEFDGEKRRTICGTPNYIAPEILEGRQGHSYEVDIWSLGVIIYTMLFGRPPFETQDVKATYRRIRYNQYTFPDHILVSDAAKELIGVILRTDPNERPTLDNILSSNWLGNSYGLPPAVPAAARVMAAASPRPDSARTRSETPERGLFQDFARIDSPAPACFSGRDQSPCPLSARVSRGQSLAPTLVRAVIVAGAEVAGYMTPGRQPSSTSKARPPLAQRGSDENLAGFHTYGNLPPNQGKAAPVANGCSSAQPQGAIHPFVNRLRQLATPASPLCTRRLHAIAAASPIFAASDQSPKKIFNFNDENVAPQNRCVIDEKDKDVDFGRQRQQQQSDNLQTQRLYSGSAFPTPLGSMAEMQQQHTPSNQQMLDPPMATTLVRADSRSRYREASPLLSGASTGHCTYRRLGATFPQQCNHTLPSPKASTPNSRSATSPERQSSLARTTCGHVMQGSVSPEDFRAGVQPTGEVGGTTSAKGSVVEPSPTSPNIASQRQQPWPRRPASSSARCVTFSPAQGSEMQAMPRSLSSRGVGSHSLADGYGALLSSSTGCDALSNHGGAGVAQDALPEIWVTKWVDYSSKYGIGYTLSDGTKGVYFNDSTKVISNGGKFEYMTRRDKDNPESRTTHTFEDYPEALKKKVTLLRHFVHYMESDTADIRDGATGGVSAVSCPPEFAKLPSASSREACQRSLQPPVYVRKWTRNKNAILFQLSNKIVQVIFFDKTEAILSSKAHTVTYADKRGQVNNYPLSNALDSPNQELTKRLRYTREILVTLLGARNPELA